MTLRRCLNSLPSDVTRGEAAITVTVGAVCSPHLFELSA